MLDSILQAIGKTPLVKLNRVGAHLRCNMYAKCEFLNPGGSLKDRIGWSMVEAAWRLVRQTARWRNVYETLQKRCGKKKAIVAIARRLLTVVVAVWRKGEKYRLAV